MNKISNPHIVSAYSNELNGFTDDVLRMGGITELMVKDACQTALRGDKEFANQIIWRDRELDEIELELEQKVVHMLALRQPLAADLRVVLSALKTAHNLERVGDLAKNIAKRTSPDVVNVPQSLTHGVKRMGEQVSMRLNLVLDAFVMGDTAQAISVWESDDEVDLFHESLNREIMNNMRHDAKFLDMGTNLMFLVKDLERIGDHCTNIAEEIHFRETGEVLFRDRKFGA